MKGWMPAARRLAGVLLCAALLPACGSNGNGTLNPTVAPQIPTGVTGVGAPLRSVLHWSPSPIATTYKVRRSLFSGGPYSDIPGASALTEATYRDLGLQNGTTYYYVVSASNSFGTSPDSSEVKVVPGFKGAQVAGGGDFSMVLMLDGSVWTMGINDVGQLGMETPPVISTVAIEVPLTEPMIAVAAGDRHCLALTADGRVWAWGDNTSFQLGNTGLSTFVPALVPGLTGVRQISANYQSSLALMADGSVKAWGDNTYGQLGISQPGVPDILSSDIPTTVPGLSDIRTISAGAGFNLALRADGTVACWGVNDAYLLGTGVTTPPFGSVTSVANLGGVTAIAAGYNHSTVLTEDGKVWTWGTNDSGQLGNNQVPNPSAYPVEVLGLPTIVGISTGQAQVLCVAADGNVWAWGDNTQGEVGIPPTPSATDQEFPIQCNGVSKIAAVSAGYFHSLAIGDDGTVWGWGSDSYGELGVGGGGTQLLPVPVPDLDSLTSVSARVNHSLALRTDGTVWAWSSNRWGESGNGTTSTGLMAPVRSGDLTDIVTVAAGGKFSAAMTSTGAVFTWGLNDIGQLGQGTIVLNSTSPGEISFPSPVTALAAGVATGYAIVAGGEVLTWGSGFFGERGDNGGGYTNVPSNVLTPGPSGLVPLTDVIAVSGGDSNSLALRSDQTVWAFGYNGYGELGISPSSITLRGYADQVPGLSGITAISCGPEWNLALKNDGTVWAWGINSNGQLGLDPGVFPISETPAPIPGLTNIVAIAAGGIHGLAIRSDGTIWTWGDNSHGQLGTGDVDTRIIPVQVAGLSGITAISAGDYFSLAVKPDGHVVGWGANDQGQLAIYPHSSAYTPIAIDH